MGTERKNPIWGHVKSEMPVILPNGVSRIYQTKVQGQVWAGDINWKLAALNGILTLDMEARRGREKQI